MHICVHQIWKRPISTTTISLFTNFGHSLTAVTFSDTKKGHMATRPRSRADVPLRIFFHSFKNSRWWKLWKLNWRLVECRMKISSRNPAFLWRHLNVKMPLQALQNTIYPQNRETWRWSKTALLPKISH